MANAWASLFGPVGKAIVDNATKGPSVDNQFLMNPEYPHSQDARDLWWNKLQDWGNDPNYGAIAPDWNDIWNQTQQKVKDYYNGTSLAPGVQNQVDSSLARRGVSDSPAGDYLHAQVGAAESKNLGDLSAQQNIAQNQFAETGRENWLTSLDQFQSQKPAGQWQTTYNSNQNPLTNLAEGVGSAAASAAIGGAANNAWLSNLLKSQNQPQAYAPSGGNSAFNFENTNPIFLS